MKRKKWLIIIVGIIMLINITFYVGIRLTRVDEFARKRLADYLSKSLSAEVSIGSLTFNDKQLSLEKINIYSPDGIYDLEIEHIYIEYHLLKLLFSNFKNLRAIKHIKIFDPKLRYKIFPKFQSSKNDFKIPDLSPYFKKLDIFNGSVLIEYYENDFELKSNWKNVSVSVANSTISEYRIAAETGTGSTFQTSFTTKKGKVTEADLHLNDFFPDYFTSVITDTLDANIDLNLRYSDGHLSYTGEIADIFVKMYDRNIKSSKIGFTGDFSEMNLIIPEMIIDGNKVTGYAQFSDISKSEPVVTANLLLDNLSVEKYLEQVLGEVSAEINLNGSLFDPEIRVDLNSQELEVFGQKIPKVSIIVELIDKKIKIELQHAYWENNLFSGSGNYIFGQKLNFKTHSNNAFWKTGELEISGNVLSEISLKKNMEVQFELNDLQIRNKFLDLTDLRLSANLVNDYLDLTIDRDKGDLAIACEGNLRSKELLTNIKFKGFDLNKMPGSLPMVSGFIDLYANPDRISAESSLRIFDKNFIKFDGMFKSNFEIDLNNRFSWFSLVTNNAKYNYEPFFIDLYAEGTLDSLRTEIFDINEELKLDGWIKTKSGLQYGLNIKGNKVKISDYLKYFTDYYSAEQFKGNVSFDLNYASQNDVLIMGNLVAKGIEYAGIGDLNANLSFAGNKKEISIDEFSLSQNKDNFFRSNANIKLEPEIKITANGIIDNLNFSDIFNEKISGNARGEITFEKSKDKQILNVGLSAFDLSYKNVSLDSLLFTASQEDNIFNLTEFSFFKKNKYNFTSYGSIGYNFLTNESFPDTSSIKMKFSGDLLKVLDAHSEYIQAGKSQTALFMKMNVGQEGLSIAEGKFSLKNGEFKIKDQLEKLDKIALDFEIINNNLKIRDFRFRMGEGWLYCRNEIDHDENDLVLGMLKIGKLFIRSDENGLIIHVPEYSPKNSVAIGVFKGRDSKEMIITGPFDDLKITGDIYVSNGNIIFPPNTDNLMKLINKMNIRENKIISNFPIHLDLLFYASDNVHYITYPVDLIINPDGFLHIETEDGQIIVSEAMFISEEGYAELFGIKLSADYIQVLVNNRRDEINISGSLYKKTGDGTIITLEVYNERETAGKSSEVIRFRLLSDDPDDGTLDIISKLKYNRNMNDISDSQRNSLLQDEVIQIAGLEVGNALIDPLIFPIENQIRKWLDLDYFQLKTDIVLNLFNRYYLSNANDDLNNTNDNLLQNQTEYKLSDSDIFLQNLTIKMGKYISNDLFLDYKAQIQKPEDLAVGSEMGIYQYFTLRYDLPYKFKISYKYNILPFEEENEHEILLERSFRFW